MKETFRKNIDVFKKLAKEQPADKEADQELARVINWHIEDAARGRATTKLTQEQIFTLQKRKQEVMLRLQKDIKDLDNHEVKTKCRPGEYVTIFNKDRFFTMFNEKPTVVSKGEILTDLEWGTKYYLDPETVPRNVRKRYLIEKARHEIAGILNEQIIKDELGSRTTDSFKKNAYEAILKDSEHRVERWGMIAETVLKNFFKKLVIDHDLEIEVIDANVSQDVEAKIDFIIRRKRHIRGVNVETTENERIGVQFTTNFEAVLHKEGQIRRVKERAKIEEKVVDIVLVTLPMHTIMDTYEAWKISGKTPGGPDKLLPEQNKKIIFDSLLQKMFDPAEINKNWNKINNLPDDTVTSPVTKMPVDSTAEKAPVEKEVVVEPLSSRDAEIIDKYLIYLKDNKPFDYEKLKSIARGGNILSPGELQIGKIYNSTFHNKIAGEYKGWRDAVLSKLKQK